MARIKVAVIFGGRSNEHEVSEVSAAHVIDSIRAVGDEDYEVICIGITGKGHWLKYIGPTKDIREHTWEKHPDNTPCILSPDPLHKGFISLDNDGSFSQLRVDCIFPVLHGMNGEDGTIQGIFQMAGIPFVGCGLLASANCMDKDLTHTVLEAHGINTAQWVTINFSEIARLDDKCAEIQSRFPFPVYVKPANCGSSVGITKAHDPEELKKGILAAFVHDKKVIVEEEIKGKECECAVIGNEEPVASAVGEIAAANEFYDYDAKYNNNESETYIPARIPEESAAAIRFISVKAFKAMGCTGLARVDFFLCEDGTVVLNEINTLPGHTPISMYPKLLEYGGMSFSEQEDKLIKLALERSEQAYE